MNDTKENIIKALEELRAENTKISIKSVADRAKVSHSLIYNRYPELKTIINNAKDRQEKINSSISDKETIDKLTQKIHKLKQEKNKSTKSREQTCSHELYSHLQQVYSMYDQLLEERNEFAKIIESENCVCNIGKE